MKKYIVLSVNDNIDYLYYTRIAVSFWSRIGWWPIVFFHGKESEITEFAFNEIEGFIYHIGEVPGYRSDTITQMSRLYASALDREAYLMTGDIDMIPLSDYWKPDQSKITVYGHDLTGYTHYPICYIGMPDVAWDDIMKIKIGFTLEEMIGQDLDSLPQAKDPDFYKYWFSDQDLITQRLKEYGTGNIDFINRGQYSNGYAKGRVDRGSWSLQHDQFIDCHMHRDLFKAFYPDPNPQHVVKWQQHMDMLNKVWPGEDFTWFVDYTREYSKLAFGK